jgi:hypothetical protein
MFDRLTLSSLLLSLPSVISVISVISVVNLWFSSVQEAA